MASPTHAKADSRRRNDRSVKPARLGEIELCTNGMVACNSEVPGGNYTVSFDSSSPYISTFVIVADGLVCRHFSRLVILWRMQIWGLWNNTTNLSCRVSYTLSQGNMGNCKLIISVVQLCQARNVILSNVFRDHVSLGLVSRAIDYCRMVLARGYRFRQNGVCRDLLGG